MGAKTLFLDYGNLIFEEIFNRDTLLRAHKIAFNYFNLTNNHIPFQRLEEAHNKAIQSYLTAREQGEEWSMDRIMDLLLKNLNISANASALSRIYKLNDHDSKPISKSIEALPRLAKTRELGIISNCPHDSLITELRNHGLLDLFKTITISGEVGYRKPNPAIYQEAMRRADTTPENSQFASHDLEEVEGARRLGIESFLVRNLGELN